MAESQASFRPKPLKIRNITIDPPLLLAPMAGVADEVYRRVIAEHGAGMVTTEMVSVQGIVRDQPLTWELCGLDESLDVPVAVQLFGQDPEVMAEAARRVEARGAAIIDINAGCPVKKVVKQGAGASLMRDLDRLARIVEATREAVSVPVTVKVRTGWDKGSTNVVEAARRVTSAGADAIAVHGRTAAQKYSGRADWSWIKQAKAATDIPVIGNGDVTSLSLANAMIGETACDGVMIGRATRGNPWLFSAIASGWGHGNGKSDFPDWPEFYRTVHDHVGAFREKNPGAPGHFRKLLIWYSKGCRGGAGVRMRLTQESSQDGMLSIFRSWVEELMSKNVPFPPLKVQNNGEEGIENSPLNEDEDR